MTIKEKAMKTSQIYRADSAPQAPKSALRGLMQRLGLTLLACTLVIGVTGSASASGLKTKQPFARSEITLLRLFFKRMPNCEHRYSSKMEPS